MEVILTLACVGQTSAEGDSGMVQTWEAAMEGHISPNLGGFRCQKNNLMDIFTKMWLSINFHSTVPQGT